MRNSNLLKWAQSKQNDKGNRNWIHPPDALQKGHSALILKFMGNTEVDQPKGIDVVKEGIRKLKFNQQLKKAEGSKIPKVELTISIDGVAIQEPKTKRIMHQYPLHRISYCADDKGEKKFFSFIAKDCPDSERHMCFVFVSDKLAEEITLTIGQAFDLAYKRFVETSGKDLEVQRRVMLLQQRVKQLENESSALRQRLSDVLNGQASDIEGYMRRNKITNMLVVSETNDNLSDSISTTSSNGILNNNESSNGLLLNLNENSTTVPCPPTLPPVPPRSFEKNAFISDVPAVGTKLEGLLLDELDDDFNPRAYETQANNVQKSQQNLLLNNNGPPPLLAPPPKTSTRKLTAGMSMNNSQPTSTEVDPFGMGDFGNAPLDIENAIGIIDKKILEMKDGFSRGLSFGNEDFSIESLDPLRK
uniref:Putative cell death protein 6 rhodnius neglectus n=1 Tax=Rhodnius prolixus TaxID=13249 RepID=A0A4P6D847_RHOPR